jgi:hypothetical protein
LTALPFTFDGVTPAVSKAHAIIGRPLTPLSVAGMHRRAVRRTFGVGANLGYSGFYHRNFGPYAYNRLGYGYHPVARAAVYGAAAYGAGWGGWGWRGAALGAAAVGTALGARSYYGYGYGYPAYGYGYGTGYGYPAYAVQPSMAQPPMEQPSMAQPSMAQPSIAEPSMAQPSMAEPSMAQPSMAQPSSYYASAYQTYQPVTSYGYGYGAAYAGPWTSYGYGYGALNPYRRLYGYYPRY